MAVFNEGRHTAEFLVSEANGYRSREVATVAAGAAPGLKAGTVLGILSAGGNHVALDPGKSDGSQTAASILFEGAVGTGRKTVIRRDAEVNGEHLVWPTGINIGDKNTAIAALAALGIIVR